VVILETEKHVLSIKNYENTMGKYANSLNAITFLQSEHPTHDPGHSVANGILER